MQQAVEPSYFGQQKVLVVTRFWWYGVRLIETTTIIRISNIPNILNHLNLSLPLVGATTDYKHKRMIVPIYHHL